MTTKNLEYQNFYNPKAFNCKFICGKVKASRLETFVGHDVTLDDGTKAVAVIPKEDENKDEKDIRQLCLVDSEKFFKYFIPEEYPEYVDDKEYEISSLMNVLVPSTKAAPKNSHEEPSKEWIRTLEDRKFAFDYLKKHYPDFLIQVGSDVMVDRHKLYFSDTGTLKSIASDIYNKIDEEDEFDEGN